MFLRGFCVDFAGGKCFLSNWQPTATRLVDARTLLCRHLFSDVEWSVVRRSPLLYILRAFRSSPASHFLNLNLFVIFYDDAPALPDPWHSQNCGSRSANEVRTSDTLKRLFSAFALLLSRACDAAFLFFFFLLLDACSLTRTNTHVNNTQTHSLIFWTH